MEIWETNRYDGVKGAGSKICHSRPDDSNARTEEQGLSEQGLSRIPFGAEQEKTLFEAATWIRTFGRYQVVVGGILALVCAWSLIRLAGRQPLVGDTGFVLGTATWTLYLVWGGVLLLMVAKHLDLVAATDEADQAYLAVCFDRFRQYFIFEAVFGVLSLMSSAVLFWRMV